MSQVSLVRLRLEGAASTEAPTLRLPNHFTCTCVCPGNALFGHMRLSVPPRHGSFREVGIVMVGVAWTDSREQEEVSQKRLVPDKDSAGGLSFFDAILNLTPALQNVPDIFAHLSVEGSFSRSQKLYVCPLLAGPQTFLVVFSGNTDGIHGSVTRPSALQSSWQTSQSGLPKISRRTRRVLHLHTLVENVAPWHPLNQFPINHVLHANPLLRGRGPEQDPPAFLQNGIQSHNHLMPGLDTQGAN